MIFLSCSHVTDISLCLLERGSAYRPEKCGRSRRRQRTGDARSVSHIQKGKNIFCPFYFVTKPLIHITSHMKVRPSNADWQKGDSTLAAKKQVKKGKQVAKDPNKL